MLLVDSLEYGVAEMQLVVVVVVAVAAAVAVVDRVMAIEVAIALGIEKNEYWMDVESLSFVEENHFRMWTDLRVVVEE